MLSASGVMRSSSSFVFTLFVCERFQGFMPDKGLCCVVAKFSEVQMRHIITLFPSDLFA